MTRGLKPCSFVDACPSASGPRNRLAGTWYHPASVKISYEVNFNWYFNKPKYKPRALWLQEEIRADLLEL